MLIFEAFLYSSMASKLSLCTFIVAFSAYCYAFIVYVRSGTQRKYYSEDKKRSVVMVARGLFFLGFILNCLSIVLAWMNAGRPPFKTIYETLIYACFTVSAVYIVVERFFDFRVLGILVSALLVGTYVYALSVRDVEVVSVPPSLQTPIMIPHVTSYFFAYAGIAIACCSAILSLVLPKGIQGFWLISDKPYILFSGYTYTIAKFSFLLLTTGLFLGSYWGQVAWSNYWGFDPKENWALISWLLFVSYFHLRFIKNWDEKRLAWVIIFISLSILFTYLGMKYLPQSVQGGSDHIYLEDGPNASTF